jgi:aminoglycoside 6-adenylyltransferase
VRAVVMNGSRANPNAPKDIFQDYDIVYFVRDVAPYRRNPEIPRIFGEILILQTPEDMNEPLPANDGCYGYLMQFMDGTRIDLGFDPVETAYQRCREDTLTIVLLDKDNLIGEIPPASDQGYLPQPPTAKAFDDCCNEFWWVTPYVAKGLWRDELTYAHEMLEIGPRSQLMKMLAWYVGVQTDFQKSPGKLGKYLKAYLSAEQWALLERTYADAQPENTWQALFTMGELFRRVGRAVAEEFGFNYPEGDDARVSDYIRRIQVLPNNTATDQRGKNMDLKIEITKLYALHEATILLEHGIREVGNPNNGWLDFAPSRFIYAFFTFNSIYSYNWGESFSHKVAIDWADGNQKYPREETQIKSYIKFLYQQLGNQSVALFCKTLIHVLTLFNIQDPVVSLLEAGGKRCKIEAN